MTTEFCAKNNVAAQVVDTVTCTIKVKIPNSLSHRLDELYAPAMECARRMLKNRGQSSSKYHKEVPYVVSKSLIAKYQRNFRCKQIKNLVIPVCGDKGRQIKMVDDGIRVPAIFKKQVVPVVWMRKVQGHVRSIEFFKRSGDWYASICYNTKKPPALSVNSVIGVDINSVGNVAVMADAKRGKVLKLGINPAPTKQNHRNRRKNLQKAGKFRLLSKLRRKQRRRMTHENHRASKTIVDYAARHCSAIAIEDLKGVTSPGSKIKRYSEKNQWAFGQLATFICYKATLRGVPVLKVNPAYTSQMCSRCDEIHKPTGKKFYCKSCGHNEHRDANAAFNISKRGWRHICASSSALSVAELGHIGVAQAGKG